MDFHLTMPPCPGRQSDDIAHRLWCFFFFFFFVFLRLGTSKVSEFYPHSMTITVVNVLNFFQEDL